MWQWGWFVSAFVPLLTILWLLQLPRFRWLSWVNKFSFRTTALDKKREGVPKITHRVVVCNLNTQKMGLWKQCDGVQGLVANAVDLVWNVSQCGPECPGCFKFECKRSHMSPTPSSRQEVGGSQGHRNLKVQCLGTEETGLSGTRTLRSMSSSCSVQSWPLGGI